TRIQQDVPLDREAWMAFAGPLASFGIAVVSYGVFLVAQPLPDLQAAGLAFAMTNMTIAIFNLLPAFPMDGGRVLRGLLARRVGRVRATRIATSIGKWVAAAIGLVGLLSFNVILVLIAVFVYMGASAERARLETGDVLEGMRVGEFMSDRIGEV